MSQPATKTIAGVEVTCYPLPEYPRGTRLLAELTYVAMPALSSLGASIAGKVDLKRIAAAKTQGEMLALAAIALGDDGAAKIFTALEGAMQRLLIEDSARGERLIGELLSTASAVLPKPDGGVSNVDLNTPAKIQQAITGSGAGYAFLLQLIGFALGVNFGGPFAGAFAGFFKADGPPAPVTPTP